MKKALALGALGAIAAALALAMLAGADDGKSNLRSEDDNGPLTMAVYGDSPYGVNPTDNAQQLATPAFIDAVNNDKKVKLVLHVGDIHAGKQYCTFGYDNAIYDLWTQFRDPLIYTPGDNEWADCHKSGEGGNVKDASGKYVDYANGDPVANLGLVRQIFFNRPGRSLGESSKRVVTQAQAFDPAHPDDAQYVENVMWEQANVLFVTVNIPGGSNNDADPWYGAPVSGEQTQEADLRTAADLRWLDAAFAQAKADNVAGVVIQTQADMWDLDGKTAAHLTNYEPFLQNIAAHTTDFAKPVLMFNGDSHVFRSDNPLVQGAPCLNESGSGFAACSIDDWTAHPSYNVPNFHRIVVHGSTTPLEYLRVSIDAHHPPATAGSNSFGPFSWERVQP
jgi:hypothetical protein